MYCNGAPSNVYLLFLCRYLLKRLLHAGGVITIVLKKKKADKITERIATIPGACEW